MTDERPGRRRRLPRLKGQSINKLIPNFLTVSATCAGLTAVRFAVEGRWQFAVVALIVAAILDALDGRMARALNATSDFGAQLDSLSDFVSFGVAPALVTYFWALQPAGGIAWAATLFFAVCSGLRLARFNTMMGKLPPFAFNYFTGVPAPAGALLLLLPMVVYFETGWAIMRHPLLCGIWLVAVAILMVSRLPTYALKRVRVPQRYVLPTFVAAGLLIAGLAGFPWWTLTLCGLTYLASIPFAIKSFRRLREEASRLSADDLGHDTEWEVDDHRKTGPDDDEPGNGGTAPSRPVP